MRKAKQSLTSTELFDSALSAVTENVDCSSSLQYNKTSFASAVADMMHVANVKENVQLAVMLTQMHYKLSKIEKCLARASNTYT